MTSIDLSIKNLEKEEKQARSKNHLNEIEGKWEDVLSETTGENYVEAFKRYNRFRLRNLLVLKKKRPGLLLGYINDHQFPNFHTFELLKVADIVSLTSSREDQANEVDRIYYFPSSDDFTVIRKKLPKGFRPSLFLDMQAAHGHMHPAGLSLMPFPTVAGICHHQQGPAAKTICEMFDFVMPVGKVFSPGCNYQKAKMLSLPFGFNWASFHRSFNATTKWDSREVDVSVTFGKTSNPVYQGIRDQVIELMEKFKSKWTGKFVVKIASNLSKSDYINLLASSKISINVVAINGPYNYRSCEIVNSGALLFQTNVISEELGFCLDDVLEDETDFIFFDSSNLEEKLLYFLDHTEKSKQISESAQNRLKSEFSYDKMLIRLFSKVKSQTIGSTSSENNLSKDKFLLGKYLWQQSQQKDIQFLGSAFLGNILKEEKDTIRFFSNILAILPELIHSLGFETLKSLIAARSNDLADSLDPNNLKQIAVQLLSVKMDHVAMWYNFLSLSVDFQWSPKVVLQQIADQAMKNNTWEGYSQEWLLRFPSKLPENHKEDFNTVRYQQFILPLMRAKNYQEEWGAYRNAMVSLVNY